MSLRSSRDPVLPSRGAIPVSLDQPVPWARVAMVTDLGDNHPLNDDRCLVVASRDLGGRAPWPWREFLLCLLADGATESTFHQCRSLASGAESAESQPAGWRASQLAQAIFLRTFLASDEEDVMDRLVEGLWRADQSLATAPEGRLATTLTALFVAADGTACAASIGNSALLVLPPKRRTPEARRLRKLGYQERAAAGTGETVSEAAAHVVIERWQPEPAGADGRPALAPGTRLVLLSDGIADSLPTEAVDRLVRRHAVDGASRRVVEATRRRRVRERRREKASITGLGLDNMSAIVVRFDGLPPEGSANSPTRTPNGLTPNGHAGRHSDALAEEAAGGRLLWVRGCYGGPTPESGGSFTLMCLVDERGTTTVLPSFLGHYLETEHDLPPDERLARSFVRAMGARLDLPFASVVVDVDGGTYRFAAGGGSVLTAGGGRASLLQRLAAWGPFHRAPPALALSLGERPPAAALPAPPAQHPTPPPPDRRVGGRRSPAGVRRAAVAAGAALAALLALALASGGLVVSVSLQVPPVLQRALATTAPDSAADTPPPPAATESPVALQGAEAATPPPGASLPGSPQPSMPAPGTPPGTPMSDTPVPGTLLSGSPLPGTPPAGTPSTGTPVAGTPPAGTPPAGTPMAGSDIPTAVLATPSPSAVR